MFFSIFVESYKLFCPRSMDNNHLPLQQYCDKVVNCLDVGGEGSSLIAAGGSDPVLRIWDPRKPGFFFLVQLAEAL